MKKQSPFIRLMILLAPLAAWSQVTVIQSPTPQFRSFLPSGAPNASGCVYTFTTGTSTPQATYTDFTGNTPNTNPVILDGTGSANIWISGAVYRIQVWSFGSGSVGSNCGNGTQLYQVDGVKDTGLNAFGTGPITVAAISNGIDIFSIVRATDISPSGDFLNFKSFAGTSLFKVDINGNVISSNVNGLFYIESPFSGCPAAVAAAGTTLGTKVIIPGTGPVLGCTSPVSENIILENHDLTRDLCNGIGGSANPPCSAENFEYDDGNVFAGHRFEFTTSHQDANGASLGFYTLTYLKNATANGNSGIDGISAEGDTSGTLSGTFNGVTAAEHDVNVTSTGGTITTAQGVLGYVNTLTGSTTAITTAIGIHGRGCSTIAGAAPTNCYGGLFDRQIGGGTRNYSVGWAGLGLSLFDTGTGFGGFDCEDTSHVTHRCWFVDNTSTLNIQATSAAGISFSTSDGAGRLCYGAQGSTCNGLTLTTIPLNWAEQAAPTTEANRDKCYGDSTAHGLKCSYNNDAYGLVVRSQSSVSQKTETGAADANVLTFTPAAVLSTYRACIAISVSSATSGVIAATVLYKSPGGTTGAAFSLFQNGVATPALSFTVNAAGDFQGCSVFNIDTSATNINIQWTGGGTTAAKVSATVERLI